MSAETKSADMTVDADQTPPPPAARSRGGLAKLRGAAEPVTAAARQAPPDETAEALQEAPPAAAAQQPTSPAAFAADGEAAEHEPPAGDQRRRAFRGRRLPVAVLALAVVVAVLATFVVSGWGRLSGGSDTGKGGSAPAAASSQDRFTALRAARQFAVSFFTYDYRKIDEYFRRVEAGSTGSFRADFVSKEKVLKTTLNQLKTVATGKVSDSGAGIAQISGNNAVALVAADLTASNAVTRNGEKRYRVKLALQRVNGTWLVSDFEQVV